MNNLDQTLVFDRAMVRNHRKRAADNFVAHSVLFEETATQLIDRLGDVKREFQAILDLGAHDGVLADIFTQRENAFVVAADNTEETFKDKNFPCLVIDEEFLPFAANSFDLVISNLSLHWINDLPGAFLQIRNVLKPNGLFTAALPGGHTLYELRSCLLDAELAVTGGVSPRLSPTIDAPTASALLQRAGFALPVTDQETITLTYPDIFALMRDLRGMGENNAHLQRLKHFTRQAVFLEGERLYRERFGASNGRIPATFEIIYLHGWKH